MQKEFYFDNNPQSDLWDRMWTTRTIEQELEACDIESPPRELFLSYLPRNGKIVDAGCGFGKWVIYLKRQGYDIVGIDNDRLVITKLKDFDASLQVELGNILHTHYPDNSFDAYISMGVVEHFEDGPASALREAYRVLKAKGLIFVSVPTVNVIRKLVRQPFRNNINAFPKLFALLRWDRGRSKSDLLRAVIGCFLPRGRGKYYHFSECRYSKSELENFLRECNFEVIRTVPHDFYGSRDHAIGLVRDFPFLGARNGVNSRLNAVGKLISRTLDRISPWIACSSVLCVGRSLKKGP
jgi:SAM-dependent methyltransferase